MGRKKDTCFNALARGILHTFSLGVVVGVYAFLALHIYAWAKVVCPLLKKRLGTYFGMTWASIGLIFLYNILFNHFLAMMIKPGSVPDTKLVEKMRTRDKQRANRKSVEKELEDDVEDRFYGLSKEVKSLLRYR